MGGTLRERAAEAAAKADAESERLRTEKRDGRADALVRSLNRAFGIDADVSEVEFDDRDRPIVDVEELRFRGEFDYDYQVSVATVTVETAHGWRQADDLELLHRALTFVPPSAPEVVVPETDGVAKLFEGLYEIGAIDQLTDMIADRLRS